MERLMKRVSVLGLGYIGLPTAILAAQAGYQVSGFDTNQEKVKKINTGNPTIFEPEITERLWETLKDNNFKAYADLQYSDYFVIAVPTPFKENKSADLSYVFAAGECIAQRLRPGNLVILESTVPVGTTEKLTLQLEELSGLKVGIDFFVAHCPERVLPGRIFKELVTNDRIVGGICQRSCELAQAFYAKFVKGFIHVSDDKTAEMVKLIENSSRDVMIAFANQVAGMCEQAGLDPHHVIELANKHPRVKILKPTCGVGGHCIAIDPWFLIETFPEETSLLKAARIINDSKPFQVLQTIVNKAQELKNLGVEKPHILTLGLTYKQDVDDIRESPALKIAQELGQKSDFFDLQVFDPNVPQATITALDFKSPQSLLKGIAWADLVVILVKHKEFFHIREEILCDKVVIDSCGLLYDLRTRHTQDFLEGAIKTSYNLVRSDP